ncbi:hypothetical protein TMM008_18230 [Pseudomonas sp. 008]|nr:hypothetical protein TMM008_18230 [Pseudomonas sp. 008]
MVTHCGEVTLWRGGLPPFGCAAVVNPASQAYLMYRGDWFGAAAQPNGAVRRSDKPPRHK